MKKKLFASLFLICCTLSVCALSGCSGESGGYEDDDDYDYYDAAGNGFNDEDVDWDADGDGGRSL